MLTDLTERKSLEGQLRQSQKMEAVGRLAGGIAHDFNNILTVITVTSNLLLEDQLPAEVRDDVVQISSAALRAAALTRQLLAFTRSDVATFTEVGLGTVVENLLPMLRRLLRENVRLDAAIQSGYFVHADPVQLEQIIMNLVVNAMDALPDGGDIRIAVSDVTLDARYVKEHVGVEPGEYVRLQVADTGVGMPPDILARIFEPFFTTKPLGKGTGLGLATTYAIVNRLRGRIDVRSTPGAGTVFDIYIPRTSCAAAAAAETRRAHASPEGREVVLVVEDEDSVRLVLRRSLERLGYTVREATSAENALEALEADGSVDVVVTDIMMPGMNGRQLAERLALVMPGTPVLLMTGYADEHASPDGFSALAWPVLLKPVNGRTLAREIRELLDTHPTAVT